METQTKIEADQLLTFHVQMVSASMEDMFLESPAINPEGQLSFVVRANKFGTIVFRVTL